MTYREMPLVDPTRVDPQLGAIARRLRREGLSRRVAWTVAGGAAVLASSAAFFVAPRPCARTVIAVLGVVVPVVFTLGLCALHLPQERLREPTPPWQVALTPVVLRVHAYGRSVELPLGGVRAVTSGEAVVLHLVDGSRFVVPGNTVGLGALRAALEGADGGGGVTSIAG